MTISPISLQWRVFLVIFRLIMSFDLAICLYIAWRQKLATVFTRFLVVPNIVAIYNQNRRYSQ